MAILRPYPIQLTAEAVLKAQRRNRPVPPNPAMLAVAEEAVAAAQSLAAPAAVYEEFVVRDVSDGRALLESAAGEGRLTVGSRVDLLAQAQRAVVAVCTIGRALEDRICELQEAGDSLLAFLLDSAGVMCLGAVGEALRGVAEERAAELNWGVSPALSPGSLAGWPLQGQRELCALLPLEQIGVRLSDFCVLEPHKSVSVVIGLGPGYPAAHVGSMCGECSLAGTCWRRRENAA